MPTLDASDLAAIKQAIRDVLAESNVYAGIDWARIANKTATVALTDTSVNRVETVIDISGDGAFTTDDRDTLNAVKAKTDLITAGDITVVSPVSADATIARIIIGDDYLAANGRAFEWTIDAPTGFVAGTSTCSFGGADANGNAWLSTGTIAANGSQWVLSFNLTKTQTALPAGSYSWSVEVKSASNVEHTVSLGGNTKLVRKYT